jgi:CheY-like chemotaxis protein/HAMP domain-containing protein
MSASVVATEERLDSAALLQVLMAFRDGDFTARLPADWTGVAGKVADTVNEVIATCQHQSQELERIGRVVGREGRVKQRLAVGKATGGWADSIRSVNDVIDDLVRPNDEIARVITAVASGDLTQTVPMEVDGRRLEGQFAQTARITNGMLRQLSFFCSEVTRVAREIGTEGKLGGQAEVGDVSGVWRALADSVNAMATDVTERARNIAEVTTAVANGDLSRKVTADVRGELLQQKDTINLMIDQLNAFAGEVTRVAREVGTEGKLGGQAQVPGASGTWKDLTNSVNVMASNLTDQVRNIAEVTTAVANGDLSKKVTVDVQGEFLELKNTINVMVDQLNSFAGEVTRVAREVGTDGKLGGQAEVEGVAGVWKDLTESVNLMAANLTEQVRGIARVVTAVAKGDLKPKLTVEAKGEVAALAETINEMTSTLATFAEQVTTVAREVGVEGRLGGQARVPGAAGTWKDLTDNVNQLAATLTNQIRAIAEVATAVTEGDLTRSIGVDASGEVAVLKDRINEMIRTLKETTERNKQQDWLKTNLAQFSRMLQGQRDLNAVSKLVLSELAPLVSGKHGVLYTMDLSDPEEPKLRFQAGYAYRTREGLPTVFRVGEGLIGQCALERRRLLLTEVPSNYISISSGLGGAPPLNIVVLPVLFEGQLRAVIELASFERFSDVHLDFLDQLTEYIGIVLNTIEANMRTEELLKQSQSLAKELQSQQEELRLTNEELRQNAQLLAEQNAEVERQNLEVEKARRSLEEKAEQLALTSKYKSEFLANMSHELRTPLNSLLILAQQLSENPERNLTYKQIEFANIIQSSGQELLALINDILDLTKIESGTVAVELREEAFSTLRDTMERNFRHLADSKGLAFEVVLEPDLPRRLRTDHKRLLQVLRNLLSNAFKFTDSGRVELRVRHATSGWDPELASLESAGSVIAFDVSDTGIGIPHSKQWVVFEAFQQADGTTSRKYGGTGLGLSISRELVHLLGGQIKLDSTVGHGSTFTVYLPARPSETAGEPGEDRRQADSPVSAVAEVAADDLPDDRLGLGTADAVVLIVEDDPTFARVLLDLAREAGFKGIVCLTGAGALPLARQYQPAAVTLDIGLRDMSGWKVLESLRDDAATRDIPIHIVTVFEDAQERFQQKGAATFLTKPASKETLVHLFGRIQQLIDQGVRNVLVVEDEPTERQAVVQAVSGEGIQVFQAATGQEALDLLRTEEIGCVVLDLRLPDIGGFEVLRRIHQSSRLRRIPVVVYTAAELSPREEMRLRGRARRVVMKSGDHASQSLAEEVGHFVNRVGPRQRPQEDGPSHAETRPQGNLGLAANGPGDRANAQLAGRRVLVVDDDVRNVYALTALLERHSVDVVAAESGDEAVTRVRQDPSIEVVLLDVMMPDKDGYETLREMRALPQRQGLPIIAVTARAMKGDRERCLKAGATDYIAKPVDTAELLDMLRRALEPERVR